MRKELDEKLCEDFPKIFAGRHGDMRQTCMCWGFECGDGWYDLIHDLCELIQGHIDYVNSRREANMKYNRALQCAMEGDDSGLREHFNWAKPEKVDEYIQRDIERQHFWDIEDEVPQVVAVQVKEKFGGLRFYTNGGDDVTRAYTVFAEHVSERTCEECGKPGKPNAGGWIKVRCEEHSDG